MLAIKLHLRVAAIGVKLKPVVTIKPRSCPFPDVAQHVVATIGTLTLGIGINGGSVTLQMVMIALLSTRKSFAPRIGLALLGLRVPTGGFFPLGLSGQAFPDETCVGFGFIATHATH